MEHQVCRVGIIGAGRIGKLHAENIAYHLPQFDLKAIADPYLHSLWAEKLNIPFRYAQAEEVLSHPEIDAVIIASPSTVHVEQIIAASQAGKAIFCEKPIGLTEEEIISALNVIRKNKTLLQVGFNRRFDPSFAKIQQGVLAGEIGVPHLLKITSRDPLCPSKEYCATSGGLFMDMMIHDFDMARFLMQAEITEIYTQGAVLINPDFEQFNDVDTAIVQLRFSNGALGVIDNSRQAVYGYDQRIEVFGSKGMLLANNQVQHVVTQYTQDNTIQGNPAYFFLERYQQAYLAELRAFYDAWINQLPSPVSAEDGLQALRVAKAARNSLETHSPIGLTDNKG